MLSAPPASSAKCVFGSLWCHKLHRSLPIALVRTVIENGGKLLIIGKERRIGLDAIPDDIKSQLTGLQQGAVARLEGFGWSIKFVRRPLFQEMTVVLVDPSGADHAILRDDGSVDRNIDFSLR